MVQWVKAAKAGDQHAWNMLYQQFYPALFARALTVCRKIDVAKDAVQDTFVTAFLKLGQLKDPNAFPGWIKSILVHTCYRTMYKDQRYSAASVSIPDISWEDQVNKKLDHIATDNRLYASMAMLPDALRSTVMLRHFSGFGSYEQIAGILSIPVGTVRSRLNQAKVKLAEYWQRHEDTSNTAFSDNHKWNHFYTAAFGEAHKDDLAKDRLLAHLKKDVEVVYTSGKRDAGRHLIEKEVYGDREHGSWMEPVNVMTSGSISILEAQNHNSAEFPDRCPPNSVFVLFRDKTQATRINFHLL
jgi:RNA polymerase sigma factor (sigma-70 family)